MAMLSAVPANYNEPEQADAPASDTDYDLFLRLKKLFRVDRQATKDWRREAQEDMDFVAGEQWSAEDRAHLKSLMRPIISFNRVLPIINSVSGQEINNRQEVRYTP